MTSPAAQTCPIKGCAFPTVPLYSSPPQIPRLLFAILEIILSEVAYATAVECVKKGKIHQVLDALVLDTARSNKPLDAFLDNMDDRRRMVELVDAAIQLVDVAVVEALVQKVDITFRVHTKLLLREACCITGSKPDHTCFHHWTDPGIDWDARIKLVEKVEPAFLSNVTPLAIVLNPSGLNDTIDSERECGKIKGVQWEPGSGRKRGIALLYECMIKNVCCKTWEGVMEKVKDASSRLNSFRSLVDASNFSLLPLHQYIFDKQDRRIRPLDVDKLGIVCAAPFYFNACCRSVPTLHARSSLLHDRSAPPLRLPITPHSSPLPPVPPTFDRFKKVKNVSKILPQMQLHVTPRACPPDRCSRQVPVAANYESVEKSIKAIYRDLFALHSIGYVGCHSAMLGTETLRVAAANLGTFSTEGMSDFEKTSLIDSAYKSWVDRPTQSSLGLLAFQEVVPRVLEYLKWAHHEATGRTKAPCLCDLTHLVDHLERLAFRCAEDIKIAEVQPVDMAGLYHRIPCINQTIREKLDSGKLSGKMWEGEWEGSFAQFMRSMEVSMNQYLRKKAAKEGIASTWRGLFDVVSSAQLLEESWYPSSAEVHTSEMFSTFAREEVGIVVTTASQLKEDAQAFYRMDGAERSTTVLAIYYCGPNFKAYYRRGYALAHLKMYKKAIVDFEKALIVEPRNVVAEQQLALARERV